MDKMQLSMKAFFFFTGSILWFGIWLTGFDVAHWLLFLPVSFFLFSAVTGVCPGLILFNELFKERRSQEIE